MQLKNVQDVLKEEDLVSLYCGDDENKLKTVYLDKNAKIVIEWDENDGRLITYIGYRNGYIFVIDDKNKKYSQLIKFDSDLKQTVLYEADEIDYKRNFNHANGCYTNAYLNVRKNGYMGCIDLDGNEIIKPQYRFIFPFENGFAKVDNDKEKQAIFNEKGEMVIPFEYDYLGDGFTEFTDSDGNKISCIVAVNSNKYGLINNKCEVIIPFEYKHIEMCKKQSRVFAAKKGSRYGFLDINNNTVIPFEYIYAYSNDDAFVVTQINHEEIMHGIIDCNGKIIIPLEYPDLYIINKNVIFAEKKNGKFVLLNYDNEEISDEYDIYEDQPFFEETSNLLLVKKDNKFGYINQQGELVIPLKYDNITDFRGGLAIADNNVINEKGEVLYEGDKNTNIINLEIGLIAVERKDEEKVFDIIKLI